MKTTILWTEPVSFTAKELQQIIDDNKDLFADYPPYDDADRAGTLKGFRIVLSEDLWWCIWNDGRIDKYKVNRELSKELQSEGINNG